MKANKALKKQGAGKTPYDAAKAKGGKAAKDTKPEKNPLFEKRSRNFTVGNDIQPRRDLTRFVRWPKYIKLQRQRRVLCDRLKVPPMLNQFTKTLDKNLATQLFKLLDKYRPEDKSAKKRRLRKIAAAKVKAAEGKDKAAAPAAATATKRPNVVKFGINHIAALVEQKKAKLVIIAHDVDPVEIVVWLPTLCRRMGVPYCIVKSKARLGAVVRKKTATALALVNVNNQDKNELAKLTQACKENYNDRYDEVKRAWGGGKLGIKSQHRVQQKEKALAKEQAKLQKAGAV
eukprot:CAMPEP_0177631004 /NCGR_PEP_ID=MMETSP0447-20121125/1518_1 /TAXON_ID=0 /ORGANISM="Stygamoeba regulata, Strain BSH-02190019" /LENGTH=287 /DNA_ID=CAMNT_0019132459 /DNA_START=54 /DNA_END=917 /DNA_ORIENTATION=+